MSIWSGLASLAHFIGAMCKFIRTALGVEHKQQLREAGNTNSFIRGPQATKEMWDALQVFHLTTLNTCWILELCTSESKHNPQIIYLDLMEEVMD